MDYFLRKIPPTYLKCGLLKSLNLNGIQLEGLIPQSLVNCSRLEVLDLGKNNLNDIFPYWLGTLSNPHVLVLQSNGFHGDIQNFNGTSSFDSLQMIYLSRNEFNGHMPSKLFENFKALRDFQEDKTRPMYMGEDYYQDSVIVTMKGIDLELVRFLTIFTIIDFSSNRFKGPIPEVVGELNSLIMLNFSHKSLTSNIPPSLGKLAAIESIDLSSNKLEVGTIPLANRFDTFRNDSFDGNSGLRGFPLSKKCGKDVEPEPPPSTFAEDCGSETIRAQKIALIGYGCGIVFGLSMGASYSQLGDPNSY